MLREAGDELGRLVGQHPFLDRDARRTQDREPTAVDERIWVADRRYDALDPRLDDRVGAGGRPAVVAAGLQAHDQSGASRVRARLGERHAFGMRRPRALVPPLADDAVAGHHDGADHGVGRGEPEPVRRESHRPTHQFALVRHCHLLRRDDDARQDGRDEAGTARANRAATTPAFSHPDCHGRFRNLAGSTPGWLPEGRGLSPPVGNRTPP